MLYQLLSIRKHKGDLEKRNKCKSGIKVALVFNENFMQRASSGLLKPCEVLTVRQF